VHSDCAFFCQLRTALPLPPQITLEFLSRLIPSDYMVWFHLDECLLAASLSLWSIGVPIPRFPPRLLRFRPHLSICCRSFQFLLEAERVSIIGMVVYKVTGHHLPAELVQSIFELCLSSLNLPPPADFNKIWIPYPLDRITAPDSSQANYFLSDVIWLNDERRFVDLPA
jgi:hypothetical protein